MQKAEPIRIAHVIGKWLGGGVESVVMNYYRNIDRNKIQFDFICDSDSTNIPYDEIKKMGGNIILIPPYQKIFKYHKVLKSVLVNGNYKIVHSHINTLSVFSLWAAKSANIPIRIAHSHSVINNNRKEFKRNIIKHILKPFSKCFANYYFACSKLAAISLFGKKAYYNSNVKIINNAIDVQKFSYNANIRNIIRKQLGLQEDIFVIGHVGRFVETKNHEFVIDLFSEIYKNFSNVRLVLIGDGPLKDKMEKKVINLNMQDAVFFLGQKDNVQDYYQAFDLFVFPSLYEGLGMTIIESQCSNLPCIVSSVVPGEVKLINNVCFIELSNKNAWTEQIKKQITMKNSRKNYSDVLKKSGYDIKIESKKLENIYYSLFNNEGFSNEKNRCNNCNE